MAATAPKTEKIDIKEALKLAVDYIQDLYGNLQNLALEEVEESEDQKFYFVTLGFDRVVKLNLRPHAQGKLQELFGAKTIREYKMFKVDASTGRVLSMKIRKVD